MKAVLYARVSQPSIQDAEDKVSIDQQLKNMRELVERNGWVIAGEFVDRQNYKATQNPKRGKMVNPSGERADRPKFLAMLEVIKAGDADIVLCWRDDRLVRHPRVAVALEDALDIGDITRNGRARAEICDATGAIIDRFTLSIKATIWREENKRRAERVRMGKEATLRMGRWPGSFKKWGYKSVKVLGQRGRIIVEDTETAPMVRDLYKMYDSGMGVAEIRKHLINNGAPQLFFAQCKHEWSKVIIYKILRSPVYLGEAIWTFKDGIVITVEVPQIIETELWHRVQKRMDRNKRLSERNAKDIYLLQGMIECGECGNSLNARYHRSYKGNGGYQCHTACLNPQESHPTPYTHNSTKVDWAVWRHIVDYGIKQPELIRSQVLSHQAELQAQGDSIDGDIAHIRHRLTQVDSERAFYQKQAARQMITEKEFDGRMDETKETREYWESELERLHELRDDAAKIRAGLDYATELLTTLQAKLPEIDQTFEELEALPKQERDKILKARKEIIQALCEKVIIYADRRIVIEGMLDGSEAAQFELQGY